MPERILRTQQEEAIYFVNNTTIQETFLMLPSERINEIITGSLARAAELHQVKIYAFIFLINRFYMLLSAPELNLPEFMKTLQQELALELNLEHERRGKFFEGRYQKSEVLDKEALLERYIMIVCSAIEAGLTPDSDGWAGLSSWDYFLNEESISGTRINRTELGKLKRKAKNKIKAFKLPADAGQEYYEFRLAKLPGFEDQSDNKYRNYLKRLVDSRAKSLREKRGGQFIDPDELTALHWSTSPKSPGLEAKPSFRLSTTQRKAQRYQFCYGEAGLQAAHILRYKLIRDQYAQAMKAYVEEYDASKFPPRTCRPGLIVCEKPEGWEARNTG